MDSLLYVFFLRKLPSCLGAHNNKNNNSSKIVLTVNISKRCL